MLIFSILNYPFPFMVFHCLFGVGFFFDLSELVFSVFSLFKGNSARDQKGTKQRDWRNRHQCQLNLIVVQDQQLVEHTHPVICILKEMIKLYLGCVIIAKAYTKISNPYVFENFQAEVGAFRTKVVEVIIGDSDSIKSCKTEKKQRLIPCLPFPSPAFPCLPAYCNDVISANMIKSIYL